MCLAQEEIVEGFRSVTNTLCHTYMENHVHSTLAINTQERKPTWGANINTHTIHYGKYMYSAAMA